MRAGNTQDITMLASSVSQFQVGQSSFFCHYCEGQSLEPPECCYSMPHTSSLGAQLQLEENRKWQHFVPSFQGKWMVSEAVGWFQSYHGVGVSLLFLSWAWGGSVGGNDLSTIVYFFHSTGTDSSICHFLDEEMHDSGCGAVALSQTQWGFLLVITLFYYFCY